MTTLKPTRRGFLTASATMAGILAAPSILRAQNWPSRPITIVCGFSPGGTTDALARLVAASLSTRLGQPVVVENRTGAAGAIGMTAVARARPDGNTLLFSAVGQLTVVSHVSANLAIDPRTAFEHISLLAEGDFILNASTGSGINSMEELITAAKAKPGSLLYGTSGAGGNLHLFTEAVFQAAGIKLRDVHYSGGSTLMPDLLNNQVQVSLNSYPLTAPYIQAGQLKPLLIVGRQRNADLPNVPTGPEVGYESLSSCVDWFGLHAPAGTPREIINELAAGVKAASQEPTMIDRLKQGGLRNIASTPEEFTARIKSDYALFGQIAESAGMKAS
jgi:tripartite-type tricarboxylate transporter receptor subunit TctC